MKLLVTGSSGLIGSEVVSYFCNLGWEVHGVDNNMRADFFGPQGDTRWNQERLKARYSSFQHHELDIRDRKAASDVLVQEYGRYFGLKCCVLSGGGLTGPNHSGVELHGFLSYLVKCNLAGRTYKIFGYKGKQVRDNIHSYDVARFMDEFRKAPRCCCPV
jgi:nucleoside-diphosphate-sugar epimerase